MRLTSSGDYHSSINSFIHSFINSFLHSFIHHILIQYFLHPLIRTFHYSYITSWIQLFMHTSIRDFTYSYLYLFILVIHPLSHWPKRPLLQTYIDTFIYTLMYLCIHAFIHPFILPFIHASQINQARKSSNKILILLIGKEEKCKRRSKGEIWFKYVTKCWKHQA